MLECRPGAAHAQPVGDDVGRDGEAGQHGEQRGEAMPAARPRHDVAQRHGERDQAEAQQQDAGDVLRPQVLADEAARHQRHQQRPQPARDRIGVARDRRRNRPSAGTCSRATWISTELARYFHAAGSIQRQERHGAQPHHGAGGHDDAEGRQPVRLVGLQNGVPRRMHQGCHQQQPDDQGFDDHSAGFQRPGNAEGAQRGAAGVTFASSLRNKNAMSAVCRHRVSRSRGRRR